MNHSYEDIGHFSVTFPADGCSEGAVCTMGVEGLVRNCEAGEPILGKTEYMTPTYAAIQIGGFVEVNYSGTAPQLGYQKLSGDGDGGVKADSNGQAFWVISVNREYRTLIMKL